MRMAKKCRFVWHVHFLRMSSLNTTVGSTVLIQLLMLWVSSTSAHNLRGGIIPGYSGMAEKILCPFLPAISGLILCCPMLVLTAVVAAPLVQGFTAAWSVVSCAERVYDAQQQG